ncbi:MAG: DsbA family protein [Chloroflexota bacterium]|nr:DsbA family protein [Chloroflexota bacterium]
MTTLTIYVLEHCSGCDRARQTADAIRRRLPEVRVEVVDLDDRGPAPAGVVGVPAYVVNGRVVSHGNPRLEALLELLSRQAGA